MKIDPKVGKDYTFIEVDKEGLYFKGWDGTPSEDNLIVTTDMRQAKMFRITDSRNEDVGARKEMRIIRELGHKTKFCILDFVPRVKDRWTRKV